VLVEDYSAGSACAYVDTENWDTASFLQKIWPNSCFRPLGKRGELFPDTKGKERRSWIP
jgi:hypothetical protein